tara:strand:- start:1569 stop:2276 length:708 start_codon:yes stop_codon:yes gene_type:complete
MSNSDFKIGDLVACISNRNAKFGEIVGVDLVTNKVEVSCLKRTTLQNHTIWQFEENDEWIAVNKETIVKHVAVPTGSDGAAVSAAWNQIGFTAGGDGMSFCLTTDAHTTTLPILECDGSSDEDDEEEMSTNPSMHGYADDGFVVADNDPSCEPFSFADPNSVDLSEEARQFVEETHQSVRDFDKWEPTTGDKQAEGIKAYISNADRKACIQTDNARFNKGKSSISFTKPPLKRKR